MEVKKVKQIYDNLKKYDYIAKDNDFITVTEWSNGEGYDICINEKQFMLTQGQLDAINYLIRALDYEADKTDC